MWINKYWKDTRTPLYSFLLTVPLFFIYEIGIFLTSSSDLVLLRNGADAIMRHGADALMGQILSAFGMNGFYWMGVIFFLGFTIVFIYQRQNWPDIEIHSDYLFIMLSESLIWSTGLYFFMSNAYILLMNPNGSVLIQQVTLAVGAGIYEEILFRVILIAGIASILGFVFQWSEMLRNWIAMLIAAGIFSSFHFIGEFGDYFSFNIFMVRFFAGILLGILYFMRGFGITAWTHAIYDLIIITRMTTQ